MRYGISIVFALTLLYCVFLDVIPWGRDKLPSVYCAYRNSGASDICILAISYQVFTARTEIVALLTFVF